MTDLKMESEKNITTIGKYRLTATLIMDDLTFEELIILQTTLKKLESERLIDIKLKHPTKMKHTQTTQHLRISDDEKGVIGQDKTLEEVVKDYRDKFPNSQRSYLAIARQFDALHNTSADTKPDNRKLAPVPVRKTEPETEKKPIPPRSTSHLVSHYPSSGPSVTTPTNPKSVQEQKTASGKKEDPVATTDQQPIKPPEKLTRAQLKELGKPRIGQKVKHIGSVNSEYYGKKGEIVGITDGKVIEVRFDEGKTAKIHALNLKPV